MTLTLGSLCSGYEGLGMAVAQVLDVELTWVADPDPGAAAVLAHHWPDVPNLGDITTVDWADVPPVDVVCGGYPCQPFSVAGKRKGTADDRHLWPHIADALRVLRPRLALFENVANHLGLGFADVLADLAGLGFDAEWRIASASEVGAPHQRRRLFILAWPADSDRPRLEGRGLRRATPERCETATDASRDRRHEGRSESTRILGRPDVALGRDAAPDPASIGHRDPRTTGVGGLASTAVTSPAADADREPVREQPVPVAGSGGPSVAELDGVEWGHYGPAIDRWARVLGRPAPRPTEPGRSGDRLSPAFVEWLMGLPLGHVTAVPGLTRNQQLRALGNGVVPQQGAAALIELINRMGHERFEGAAA